MVLEQARDGHLLPTTQFGLPAFELYRPDSLDDLRTVCAEAPRPLMLYAGGTDAFAALREGRAVASLVRLDRIEELRGAVVADGVLTLGAGLTHFEAMNDPALAEVPGLAEAWARIATVRVRRHATLGGNLMARRPRYELSILLSALGATARLVGASGEREVPVEAIWDLPDDEPALLVSVAVPLSGAPRLDYARDLRPVMTQALCRRDGAAMRLAVGTERLRPHLIDWTGERDAAEILAGLPEEFEEPGAGRGWMVRAGAALLERQLERMAA